VKIILDLPDPDSDKFINRIKRYVEIPEDIEVIAEHGADDKYPVCSAASIIAKVDRDNHVADLSEEYGLEIRTGYPHEKSVNDFLEKIVDEGKEYPDFVRTSWRTAERVKENKEQSKIGDY
ncbi:MAG: ribonuclease HII, partial [archaeon]